MPLLKKVIHQECQYLNLICRVLNKKNLQKSRNGHVYQVLGESMRFSLENNTIPILTTKKLAWRTCLKELLWFIGGKTDNSILQEQKVKIWNKNANGNNDLGPIYGHQWRHFNAEYNTCETDYTNKGVDQLQNIIDVLSGNSTTIPTSRRLILSAWNPCQLDEMALPPCHILSQFQVTNKNELSCILYQRSGDIGLGIPFNIASYGFLTHLLARHCHLKPKELIHFIGNAHIYDDHKIPLEKQAKREPLEFPTLTIKKRHENIDDYILDDFEINNYTFRDKIKMNMRV